MPVSVLASLRDGRKDSKAHRLSEARPIQTVLQAGRRGTESRRAVFNAILEIPNESLG